MSAALRAADTLFDVLGSVRVVWYLENTYPEVDGDFWEDYQEFYHSVVGTYALDEACVSLVEASVTSEPDSGPSPILGLAVECGACETSNVAIVRSGLDANLTYGVILHELGHLFCAPHIDEEMNGVMNPFAGSRVISEQSALEMRRGMLSKFRTGVCPLSDTEDLLNKGAAFPSASHDHHPHGTHGHGHSHIGHYDDYDTAVGIVLFSFLALVLVGLLYGACVTV